MQRVSFLHDHTLAAISKEHLMKIRLIYLLNADMTELFKMWEKEKEQVLIVCGLRQLQVNY